MAVIHSLPLLMIAVPMITEGQASAMIRPMPMPMSAEPWHCANSAPDRATMLLLGDSRGISSGRC